MKEIPSIMVKCNCGSEFIEVQYWDEYKENEFYFSLWSMGFHRPMCWREKLRWCWKILRSGDPWADSIIVSNKQAKKIADFINKYQSNGKEKTNTNRGCTGEPRSTGGSK